MEFAKLSNLESQARQVALNAANRATASETIEGHEVTVTISWRGDGRGASNWKVDGQRIKYAALRELAPKVRK